MEEKGGGGVGMKKEKMGVQGRRKTRGWESIWVKMHPQHICKSLAVEHRDLGEVEGIGVD